MIGARRELILARKQAKETKEEDDILAAHVAEQILQKTHDEKRYHHIKE